MPTRWVGATDGAEGHTATIRAGGSCCLEASPGTRGPITISPLFTLPTYRTRQDHDTVVTITIGEIPSTSQSVKSRRDMTTADIDLGAYQLRWHYKQDEDVLEPRKGLNKESSARYRGHEGRARVDAHPSAQGPSALPSQTVPTWGGGGARGHRFRQHQLHRADRGPGQGVGNGPGWVVGCGFQV